MSKKKDKLCDPDFTIPAREQKYFRAKMQAEFERKAQTFKIEKSARRDVSGDPTVRDFTLQWLAKRKKFCLKPDSYESLNNTVTSHILPVIGQFKMCNVKPMHIKKVMLSVSSCSKSIQWDTLSAMYTIFNRAVDGNVILSSPVTSNFVLHDFSSVTESSTLTLQQCKSLIKAVKGTSAELLVALHLGCGLRKEEACGLKWSDFQRDRNGRLLCNRVTIRNTIGFRSDNGLATTKELKGMSGCRTMPVMPWAAKIIRDNYSGRGYEYVLSGTGGEPLTRSEYYKILRNISESSARTSKEVATTDLTHPNDVQIIDFRVSAPLLYHTYIMFQFKNHFDLREVQYLLDSSSPKFVLEMYAHYKKWSEAT